ncbi:MAG: FliH/SctL family protein [Syntrophomonadaceae bacterium]
MIKGSQLMLAQPKVIDTLDFEYVALTDITEEEQETALLPTPVELENEQLERIKEESRRVLQDTESMVAKLLEKAREEARTIIDDAKKEAAAIRTQASEEAGQMRTRAEEEGYEQGLKRAQQEIEADRQLALQQSQQIIEQARQTKISTIRSLEPDIIRLVMAIARKIIAGEIATNPGVIVNVVREAIHHLDNPENLTVYVNPEDMEQLAHAVTSREVMDIGNSQVNIEVRSDDRMDKGGCLIESDSGRVDAQLNTRLMAVETAIKEVTADG